MNRILDIIGGTPFWIWPFLALLLWPGWRAGQPRTIAPGRIFVLPAAVFIMSVSTLIDEAPGPLSVLIWCCGIAAGCGIGFVAHRDNGLRVDRDHGLLHFPGEWRTMGLISVVFALRYYWGYQSAVHPELVAETGVIMSYLAFNGVLSGIFIGWRLHTIRVYRTGLSEDLSG